MPASAEGPKVLLALGDSLTAGYGLAEGEGLVPLGLQGRDQELADVGDVIHHQDLHAG